VVKKLPSEFSHDSDGVDWQWRAVREPSDFYDSLVQAALRHIPIGSLVLEVGVGSGYLLAQLAARARCSCVGVDLLPTAMQAAAGTAQAHGVEVRLLRGSGFALPFPDSVFDVVMSHGVVEHFPRARARSMLSEHARVCRPGGLVIVSVPNSLDVVHGLRKLASGKRYLYYPERSHSRWSLARELRAVGLDPRMADGYAPLWSLRQMRGAYPVVYILYKLGLLKAISGLTNPVLLSLVGNLTLQVAGKPGK
jgi:ubiquinone/menaquinone biosynthesis C-methylase UbiE